MSDDLYKKLRSRTNLRKAWQKVKANGKKSKSKQTQQEIREFDSEIDKHLSRIGSQLRENRFRFGKSVGISLSKGNSAGFRPIVISPIENRIVQRSILDVMQEFGPLKSYFDVPTSFGGIKGKGVREAIEVTYQNINTKATKHYIRSDIKSFFTKIPKVKVFSLIESLVDDDLFIDLFKNAASIELSNLEKLGEKRELFPLQEIGVAQGSSLSPLIGNIVLHEFDSAMNTSDVLCVRYIDDFLIIAPSTKILSGAFRKAQKILAALGMTAYQPHDPSGKCEKGCTNDMFSFLGCDIRKGMIRPSRRSWGELLESIVRDFDESKSLMNDPEKLIKRRCTLVETLSHVSNVVKGWGSQYSFCNDVLLMSQIDEKVDGHIRDYLDFYALKKNQLEKVDTQNRRRLMGVTLISDCKRDPIVQTK